MKNIHIRPTEELSRFSLNSSGAYHFTYELYANSPNFTNQNVYITSNEEIKEGNWYLDLFKTKIRKTQLDLFNDGYKKIILTTDVNLIKDGVHSINDEFLEWFVKNPSCEYIEVRPINIGDGKIDYINIICRPKETPEQHVKYINQNIEEFDESLESFKEKQQDALEDLIILKSTKYANDWFNMHETNNYQALKQGYEAGARDMAKVKYNEDEVLQLLQRREFDIKHKRNILSTREWFNQVKK